MQCHVLRGIDMETLKTLVLDSDDYDDEQVREEAKNLIDSGYTTVKIYVSLNGKDSIIYYGEYR